MSLNNIVLPASVIADLYQSSLIDTVAGAKKTNPPLEAKSGPKADNSNWQFLGNNQKNILIVVKYPDADQLPDDELNFLKGILAACKLNMDDIALINLATHPDAAYKELTTAFKSRVVILFDLEPAAFGLPMNFPHYQIQAFAKNSFLYSPSLAELQNDKLQKSKLWVSLKRLFNI
jgi:hypothetical protein